MNWTRLKILLSLPDLPAINYNHLPFASSLVLYLYSRHYMSATKTLALIKKGTPPNARVFLVLPHGKDAPIDIRRLTEVPIVSRYIGVLEAQGNLVLTKKMLGDYYDKVSRMLFLLALACVRREVHEAATFGEQDPDQDPQND